jgi:undecaprenyl-diphosphatase
MRTAGRFRWLRDAEQIDRSVYAAIAATPTPALDGAMSRLTVAANRSQLWFAIAALLAVGRGAPGRRTARAGVASIAAASAVVNGAIKPLGRRRRPAPVEDLALARRVRMPSSTSFPSGHAASAFAFATAVGHFLPRDAIAVRALAALVAYSRVHTGVHYPGDVVAGSLLGGTVAQLTIHALDRRRD